MGFLATVAEFLRSSDEETPTPEIKVDRDGEDAVTAFCFAPPGTDAPPLPGDVAYLGDDIGAGNAQALGYQDPKNAGTAAPGEHRTYGRDGEGAPACQVWLKADGSIVIGNEQGTLELGADGGITIAAGEATATLGADGAIGIGNGSATATLGADGAIDLSNGTGGIAVDAAGNVTATTPLGTFGAGTHTHTTPFGPSGPPMPGT